MLQQYASKTAVLKSTRKSIASSLSLSAWPGGAINQLFLYLDFERTN